MFSRFDLLLVVGSVVAMLWGFTIRYRMWRQGRIEGDSANKKARKICRVLLSYISHRKILQDYYGGISHLFIFWGFIIMFAVVIIAQFKPTMPLWIARGLSLLLDVVGALALTGTAMLLARKHTPKQGRSNQKKPATLLWIFLAILITGFLSEAGRLSLTEGGHAFANLWSPVGSTASYLMPASPILLKLLIRIHFFLVLLFLTLLPFSVMRHMIAATLSTYYRKEKAGRAIEFLSLDAANYGAGNVRQFTYKKLLAVDACMGCGRCDRSCPPYLCGHPLSPQNIVQNIRERMEDLYFAKGNDDRKKGKLLEECGMLGKEDIWRCTTCMACVESCPAYVGQLEKIVDMRRNAVLTDGKYYPPEYKQVFKNMEIFGDILGKGKLTREDWDSNSNFKRIYKDSKVDTLLWIGCISALYDEKSKDSVMRAASILRKAGVNFGVLGKEELCCGDFARRMGNEYLFQKLAGKNIETLKKYEVRKIVVICPHCFNVLHNEYPQLGGDFEVRHLTQVISDSIQEGKLEIKTKLNGQFTYHDPCYLGRYNGIYQAPRDILKRALDLDFKEMAHSKEGSLCCGAGGGNFWRKSHLGKRIEELRVEEAALTESNAIVSACPFCRIMFDSAVKQKSLEYQLKAMDIIDVVAQVS